MAMLDSGRPPRDILPPINHPDFEKLRTEKSEPSRFPIMPGLSIPTTSLGSPNGLPSGPPPPYSDPPSTTESAYGLAGYLSPHMTNSRRSTRDEKDILSNKTLPSLPSLHEALGGHKSLSLSGPPSATPTSVPGSNPATIIGQAFPEGARGPPNPFSHSASALPHSSGHTQTDSLASKPGTSIDPTSHLPQPYSSPPQPTSNNIHRASTSSYASTTRHFEPFNGSAPFPAEAGLQHPPYRDHTSQPTVPQSQPSPFNFEPTVKFDESRNPFANSQPPYGETVKRHLENFDAEVALNEIVETSSRTYDFSRSWIQRHHQNNRMNHFADSAPTLQEINEMIRQHHRMADNLTRVRDFVVMQQNVLSEQRARAARGNMEDEYHGVHEDYKSGGFAGGDAKKRRGKAAPPGRCHSCQRAETPEWRRGPDGARTLCNACGLHYAKLTRKLGANKASALTGSNLRPKGLDARPAHV